jgi:hypothetical protein|uniref:Uncharacterized protein n=1 Tax=uncultured marine virus TaxID=186617 RepID=A0A0F7L3X0_9VIRU|nr:hypothetical protein [uncultured marine virus]
MEEILKTAYGSIWQLEIEGKRVIGKLYDDRTAFCEKTPYDFWIGSESVRVAETEMIQYLGSIKAPYLIGERVLFYPHPKKRNTAPTSGVIKMAYNGYRAPRYLVLEDGTGKECFIWGRWLIKSIPK